MDNDGHRNRNTQNETMRLWRSFPRRALIALIRNTWSATLGTWKERELRAVLLCCSATRWSCSIYVGSARLGCCTKENDHFRPAQFFQVSAMHDATSCTLHVFEAEWKHTSSTRTGRYLIKLICFEACNALIATVLYKRMQERGQSRCE